MIRRIAPALALVALWMPAKAADSGVLTSVTATAPPTIDGTAEAAWDAAPPLEVTVDKLPYQPDDGYPGMTATTVTLRSMHDAQSIYLLVQYPDPTHSIARLPWVKQEDGSWKQSSNKDSTGHENTWYEDKLAILWDINARGFAKKGCAAACHVAEDGKVNGIEDKAPGRKYTASAGQTIDMWHWKSVRSAPVGQVDDQYIDSTADPSVNENWGRRGDAKTGGGYANNKSEDGKLPAFMPRDGATGAYWLLAEEKVPFEDQFKAGDILPGIIVSRFEGSRGDIAAQAVWADGVWTIEMQRSLTTSGEKDAEQDVQFADLSKSYSFGVSVFDNSQINHLYHEGAMQLKFSE